MARSKVPPPRRTWPAAAVAAAARRPERLHRAGYTDARWARRGVTRSARTSTSTNRVSTANRRQARSATPTRSVVRFTTPALGVNDRRCSSRPAIRLCKTPVASIRCPRSHVSSPRQAPDRIDSPCDKFAVACSSQSRSWPGACPYTGAYVGYCIVRSVAPTEHDLLHHDGQPHDSSEAQASCTYGQAATCGSTSTSSRRALRDDSVPAAGGDVFFRHRQ